MENVEWRGRQLTALHRKVRRSRWWCGRRCGAAARGASLLGSQLGLSAAELACSLVDRQALTGASTDRVSLELGHHAEDVDRQPADKVGKVVDRSPRSRETPFFASSPAMSVASRRDRARQSSLVTTRTSPARHGTARHGTARHGTARHAAKASRRPGGARVVPDSPWST
jgi:hypothetical protein